MQRFLDRDLGDTEVRQMMEHLRQCPECTAMFDRLVQLSGELEQLPKVSPPYSIVDAILPQLQAIDAEEREARDGQQLRANVVPGPGYEPKPRKRSGGKPEADRSSDPRGAGARDASAGPATSRPTPPRRRISIWAAGSVVAAGILVGVILPNHAAFDFGGLSAAGHRSGALSASSNSASSGTMSSAAESDSTGADKSAAPKRMFMAAEQSPSPAPESSAASGSAAGSGSSAGSAKSDGTGSDGSPDSAQHAPIAPQTAAPSSSKDADPVQVSSNSGGPYEAADQYGASQSSGGNAADSKSSGNGGSPTSSAGDTANTGSSGGSGNPASDDSGGSAAGSTDNVGALVAGTASVASPDGLYQAAVENNTVTIRDKAGKVTFVSGHEWGAPDQVQLIGWTSKEDLVYQVVADGGFIRYDMNLQTKTETKLKTSDVTK